MPHSRAAFRAFRLCRTRSIDIRLRPSNAKSGSISRQPVSVSGSPEKRQLQKSRVWAILAPEKRQLQQPRVGSATCGPLRKPARALFPRVFLAGKLLAVKTQHAHRVKRRLGYFVFRRAGIMLHQKAQGVKLFSVVLNLADDAAAAHA